MNRFVQPWVLMILALMLATTQAIAAEQAPVATDATEQDDALNWGVKLLINNPICGLLCCSIIFSGIDSNSCLTVPRGKCLKKV